VDECAPAFPEDCAPLHIPESGLRNKNCIFVHLFSIYIYMILGKWPTWRTILYCVVIFILTLYIFRVHRAHHQERQTVSKPPLVTVTLCRCRKWVHFRPSHYTATDTEWQLPKVVWTNFVSPDDEHDALETCRELNIKVNTQERIVRHVGHLPRII
jgi:hypothetical protein